MTIRERLLADLTTALKTKDTARLEALRMVKAAIQKQEIEVQHQLDDAETTALLSTLIKQRREATDAFVKGGREDLAAKERAEAELLESYLPPPIGVAELDALVTSAIAETGAGSPKDIGLVMKAVMAKLAGQRVDGKAVNELVRAKLSNQPSR
ncbi:MAG: GatB/YqeY domain-containing protein [Chloracidobacterium sp.]|uniref:GatB/YqeY domain-containing protein n=1 Tax=Chloracidobacterium validum TaxID=2821543 RepID=A0ABX8B653_9BACT|nr:GatB/YqeY domain-containing protein [Chloracidobacterium validum]QUW02101.1 GatB/YqeY domain-containing protein [Chloracidobacterium validum]